MRCEKRPNCKLLQIRALLPAHAHLVLCRFAAEKLHERNNCVRVSYYSRKSKKPPSFDRRPCERRHCEYFGCVQSLRCESDGFALLYDTVRRVLNRPSGRSRLLSGRSSFSFDSSPTLSSHITKEICRFGRILIWYFAVVVNSPISHWSIYGVIYGAGLNSPNKNILIVSYLPTAMIIMAIKGDH